MAVAIKNQGYTNIKIYNGGIKDWKKAGLPVASIEPLPEYSGAMVTGEEVYAIMQRSENCTDENGNPLLTILDFRIENSLEEADGGLKRIKTRCPVITCLLDEVRLPEQRARIPKEGLVVTITETGNRDDVAMRYLSLFGYTNVKGLEFGMRGWIKSKLPIE
ncbi:rhodanese-like domain-containing protein [Fundidesulfovibrio soli]|uniref:rhodanese-like domain-containing protein n=1 Tax=Fundidesulfovibrio soli TaxID=2922716 RepID=UPI001FAE9AA3|nr:rhodanese-like domain-containing protein [Fundidesulfovibrio soli]